MMQVLEQTQQRMGVKVSNYFAKDATWFSSFEHEVVELGIRSGSCNYFSRVQYVPMAYPDDPEGLRSTYVAVPDRN